MVASVTLRDIKARCFIDPVTRCWEWLGCVQGNGYGRVTTNGKSQYVHRVVYRLARGTIESGYDVCHKCDNRKCANPKHLFQGTRKQNMEDCVAKQRHARGYDHGTHCRGDRCHFSILTWEKVREIRKLWSGRKSTAILAMRFGVSKDNIRRIIRLDTWKERA